MKKAKKVLYLTLTYVLVAVLCIGGTIAYLTSQDEDVNVMTLGNVEIEQLEYERIVDDNGDFKFITTNDGTGYELQEFTQAKKLNPAYGQEAEDTNLIYFDQLGNAEGTDAPIANLKGAQDKYVFVKNTGINDAYVRTLIAYEVGEVQDAFGRLIIAHTSEYYTAREVGVINVEGNNYYLVEYTYKGSDSHHMNGILPSGEITYNSLAQVYMSGSAKNDDVKNIDGNNNGTYDILVVSQAIQAENFPDAKTALEEGFYVVTTTQHPWVNGADIDNYVTTENKLLKGGDMIIGSNILFKKGEGTVLNEDAVINLNGYTLSSNRDHTGNNQTIPEITTLVVSGANVVIEGDGAIVNNGNQSAYALTVNDGAHVTIKGGEYVAYHDPIYLKNGTLVVEGGFFEAECDTNPLPDDAQGCFNPFPINISNNDYVDGNAELIIKGGTFVNTDPSNLHEIWTHNLNFVADGYKVVSEPQDNGDIWYSVIPE